ncbi:cilia- and flagella-associated protein 157-like [Centruroides vittatus]|uniref:cilia- and flagella-associated protein 157-like n=1 Tax=Centruroides vittatus TaxID=120091 RepID=UPI00350F159D
MLPKKGLKKDVKRAFDAEKLHMTITDKVNYESEINCLNEELLRLNELLEEKKALNKKHREEYENEKKDKEDIVSYLNFIISENDEEIKELERKLENLPNEHKTEKENIKKEIDEELAELINDIKHTESNNLSIEASLANLSETKLNKMYIEESIKTLNQTLNDDKENYAKILDDFEKHFILENDRIRNELIRKVEEMASEYTKISDDILTDKIIHVLKENVVKKKELRELGEITYQLLNKRDNFKLKIVEIETRKKIEEHRLDALTRDYNRIKASINEILKSLRRNSHELEKVEKLWNENILLKKNIPYLQRSRDSIENKITHFFNRTDELNKQLMEDEKEIQRNIEEIRNLKILMKNAANIITEAIICPSDNEEEMIDYNSKRQNMLKCLIDLFELVTNMDDKNHYKELILIKFEPKELMKQKTAYKAEAEAVPKYITKPNFKNLFSNTNKQTNICDVTTFKKRHKYPRSRIIRGEMGLLSRAETIEALEKLLRR